MRSERASRTAMMVALWRSLGDLGITSVPGFSDPAARLLSGAFWRFMLARAEAMAREPRSKTALGMLPWVDGLILRVAFIDAEIAAAGVRQIVILGAGLDTRAWRLSALRGARVFEVDHPSTQAYKREHAPLLGPPLAEVRFVPVDFARDDLQSALSAAGHDASSATTWVWEGVIMYLDDAALRSTLGAIRHLSAPGSVLVAHYHEPEATRSASAVRGLIFSWLGEPQLGLRTRQTIERELTGAGFQLVEDADLAKQAARVGATSPTHSRLQVSRIAVAKI